MKTTNKESQTEIERRLSEILHGLSPFTGLRPRVSFHSKKTRRKLKDNASAKDRWPADHVIWVSFESDEGSARPSATANPLQPTAPAKPDDPSAVANPARAKMPEVADSTAELIRSLDRTESSPGYDFVALTRFRDLVLPAVRPEWADRDARAAVVRDAINRRIFLISKVPNPKAPAFPVTAIRLNRSLLEVQAILGPGEETTPDFQPVVIRGEALSKTVLRERR